MLSEGAGESVLHGAADAAHEAVKPEFGATRGERGREVGLVGGINRTGQHDALFNRTGHGDESCSSSV